MGTASDYALNIARGLRTRRAIDTGIPELVVWALAGGIFTGENPHTRTSQSCASLPICQAMKVVNLPASNHRKGTERKALKVFRLHNRITMEYSLPWGGSPWFLKDSRLELQ